MNGQEQSNTPDSDFDVLVVGGGLVGATLACALDGSPLRVAVLESDCPATEWPEGGFDLRVSALTRGSQRVFQSLQVWESMAGRGVTPYTAMRVWEDAGDGIIEFSADDIGEPDLGHIVENRVILAALYERILRSDNIRYLCPAEPRAMSLEEQGAAVALADGRRLTGRVVVGADGARSWVRGQAGITTTGWGYGQTALVATVETSLPHGFTAHQRFLPDGPVAFLPLSGNYSSIVWTTTPDDAARLAALDTPAFLRELQVAFGDTLGEMIWCGERATFPLALMHADDYVRPRMALVGNAAHSIHPLAGQGLNLGICDAAALAQVLLEAVGERKDLGAYRVLRRYERWRKGDNVAVMAAMDGFKRLFGSRSAAIRRLRATGLNLVDGSGPFKQLLIRRAMGLTGDLPRLCRGSVA